MKLSQCLERHNNNYDLLRLIFAALVIVGHAYALVSPPPVKGDFIITLVGFDYAGSIAVKFFFFLSGLMVTNSLITQTQLTKFIGARVFRIFPGLIGCTLVSILVVGPLLTQLPLMDYWRHRDTLGYASNMVLSLKWNLPGVFETNRSTAVNGSVWTLPFEVYCYSMLTALGMLSIFKKAWIGSMVACSIIAIGFLSPDTMTSLKFSDAAQLLPACFALGALMALNKNAIEVRASTAVGLLLLTLLLRHSGLFQPLFYLTLFYSGLVLASNRFFMRLRVPGDFSYGVYLYGFPVQQIAAAWWPQWGVHANQVIGIAGALVFAIPSWFLIEKPLMQWGRTWTQRWFKAPVPQA